MRTFSAIAAIAVVSALILAGCSSQPVGGVRYYPESGASGGGSIVGSSILKLTPNISVELEKLVIWGAYAGVAWWVLDPLAPNWHIEEAPLADNHIHFSLKMKRYYAGGAGEARAVFQRRAKELMQYNGFDGYQVIEYNESLESSVLGSQRVAGGVVRLTRKN
ncbi:MAG: hypothetical protein Q8O34_01425 [Rhodocyclaceae bacterium]|nr:hypothetical protein [Rhodocyclaceae bacterium]